MLASPRRPKQRRFISAFAPNTTARQWRLSRPPTRSRIRRWDFSVLGNEQSGIFIGTREWDMPSRNHFAALLVARQLCEATGEPVTAVNLDGYKGRRLLGELRFPEGKLRLIEKWKSYSDYLRDLARHKIVLHRIPQPRAGPGGWRCAPLSGPVRRRRRCD